MCGLISLYLYVLIEAFCFPLTLIIWTKTAEQLLLMTKCQFQNDLFLYSVYYSSWCEETAPSTLSAWVYAPKTNWMEVIGRPFLGLDWHIFLVVMPHTETLDLNSCSCLGQGHFVPCQQVASSLRRWDWPWHSRLLSFLPQQLSHPPRRVLYDLMEHISSLLTSPAPLLHVWPLAHFAYMYAFERYMICSSCAWIGNKSWSTLEKYSITVSVLNGEVFHLYIKLSYVALLNNIN